MPLLERGRQVRQRRRALLVEDRQRLDGAAVDLRLGGGDDLAQEVDAAAGEVLHRRSGAAIGNVVDIGPQDVVEQHAAEMGGRAGAGRAELHLALIGLGVGDELLEVADRQILAHGQDDRNLRHQCDRREIVDRAVERPSCRASGPARECRRCRARSCSRRAAASATRFEPVMPPAPPTFSTTTCWPRTSLMRCAMTRPSTSVGPPAANGMIILIGLVG